MAWLKSGAALEAFISDCGFAAYSFVDWMTLIGSMPLRDDARCDPRGHLLLRLDAMTCAIESDVANRIYREFEARRDCERAMYADIAAWFDGPHGWEYLGAIPRDILGIVAGYLRVRIVRCSPGVTEIETSTLGIPAVHDGAPSYMHLVAGTSVMRWCNGSHGNLSVSVMRDGRKWVTIDGVTYKSGPVYDSYLALAAKYV